MRAKLTAEEKTKLRSEASRKASVTRLNAIKEAEKTSLLKARVLSRKMFGIRTNALKKRADPELIVTGVGPRKAVTIHPKDFGKLELPEYQRELQSDEVSRILRAIMAGGCVIDAILLSKRLWMPGSDKLWIVDGQQRFMAFLEANLPIQADIVEVETPEAERNLFVLLNSRRAVAANNIIEAIGSKSAQLLRNADENPAHPCFGRIIRGKGRSSSARNMAASVVIRGLSAALGIPAAFRGATAQILLPKVDAVYNLEKADAFLRMLAEVTPTGEENGLRLLFCVALGKLFDEKCKEAGRVILPSRTSMSNIRKTNWRKLTDSAYSMKYLPMVLEIVREKWKA